MAEQLYFVPCLNWNEAFSKWSIVLSVNVSLNNADASQRLKTVSRRSQIFFIFNQVSSLLVNQINQSIHQVETKPNQR